MNRGLTGLLAWSALALVIAVPSTELLMTRPGESVGASKVFVGPPVAESANDAAASDSSAPILPFQPDTAPVRVVMSTQPKALPLPPIVPAGPRAKADADKAVAGPMQAEPVLETATLDAGQPTMSALSEPAYVGAENLIVPKAPIPMPAPVRPRQTVALTELAVPKTQLEQDVSRSIATVLTTVRGAPPLRGDALAPDNSRFWGDDPQYRGRQNLQVFDENDASDSAFFQLWQAENRTPAFRRRGSFEEQLPARRGSAVRLDLLQQQN